MPELLAVAGSTPDRRVRILALRGAYRLIPTQTVAAARKLAQVQEALALSDRPDEQRMALSTLAGIALPESLVVAIPYLEEPNLAEEASLAVVAILEQLVAEFPAEVEDAAGRILDVVRNPETRRRAQQVATQAGLRGAE